MLVNSFRNNILKIRNNKNRKTKFCAGAQMAMRPDTSVVPPKTDKLY